MNRNRQTDLRVIPRYWGQFDSLVSELTLDASLLELGDGTHVHLYEAGPVGAPDIIVVSPSESPFLLMSGVFRHLAENFRVTAWDHPAGVFMDAPLELAPPTLQRMSDDLLAIIEAKRMKKPHVVSWCAGALIVLWALAKSPSAFASASLIAPPSVLGTSPERTGFQSHFLQMILELASGQHPDEAALCRQIQTVPRGREVLSEADRMIFELTGRPVRDEVALRRYAKSIQNACLTVPPSKAKFRGHAYLRIVAESRDTVPMLLLHCEDDDIVSYRCSAQVAADNENVDLAIYPEGGHFVIFKEPRMLATDIGAFARRAESRVDGEVTADASADATAVVQGANATAGAGSVA